MGPDTPSRLAKMGKHNDVPILLGVNSEEGIYTAAKYIKDPTLFSEINLSWDTFGPLYIFDTETPTTKMREVAQNVKSFYLGEEEASLDNVHKVIDMFSDIVFWAGAERFVQIAAVAPRSPVFQYLLTAKSSNSYANLVLGLDDDDLGVCHADDLQPGRSLPPRLLLDNLEQFREVRGAARRHLVAGDRRLAQLPQHQFRASHGAESGVFS